MVKNFRPLTPETGVRFPLGLFFSISYNPKNLERGKYFRIGADIYVDGENLAKVLVEAGMAVRYDGKTKMKAWCKELL